MSIVHTYPLNDIVEHDIDGDDCICGPEVIPVEQSCGGFGWQILHHSLDGRERSE